MSEAFEFDGVIEEARGGGALIDFPFDPREVFGTARSVRVKARFDSFEADSNVVSMGGRAVLGIDKATRQAIGKDVGDRAHVSVTADGAPREVEIPIELASVLSNDAALRERFQALAFTHRRSSARWVEEAKRQETRDRRAAQVKEMIEDGRTP